jgi:hypothetical protein
VFTPGSFFTEFIAADVLTNSLPVHVLASTLRLHWDKPEDVMNKIMTTALIAGGLMLINSPEAAAHKEVRHTYQPPAYYQIDVRRSDRMPRWLKHDRTFRKWYRHSRLKRDRRLAWNQLYDIYRWERRWGKTYYRSDNYWADYYRYRDHHHDRDRDRNRDRDRRDRRRHRH